MATPSSIRALALVVLCVQNSLLILSMRYSRSERHDTYSDGAVVLGMEFTKFVSSAALMVLMDGQNISDMKNLLYRSLIMAVPGGLYVVQNSMQLLALQYLDASTFSILSQLKVLTTALCSILILRTSISWRKWRALSLLVVGAILVQYNDCAGAAAAAGAGSAQQDDKSARDKLIGLCATLLMVSISGIAGIVLEKYLKGPSTADVRPPTLWERNFQLGWWGMIFASGSLIFFDKTALELGVFHGFNWFTFVVIFLAAGGGLAVAVVVKYTNTIIKGFATCVSIILTSIASLFIFEQKLSLLFWLGSVCVLISIFNFNEEDAASAASASAQPFTSNKSHLASEDDDEAAPMLRREKAKATELQNITVVPNTPTTT